VFTLAEREVISASVEGPLAEDLRRCLLDSVDSLAVPRFSGLVIVRYPLVTEREALPSQIELTAQTAESLDAVILEPPEPPALPRGKAGVSLDAPDPHLHTAPSKPAKMRMR
jgi:hypothetical protein